MEQRFEPDHCANCLEPLPGQVQGLFCSELCSQTAEIVRYWRRIDRDERGNDPEVRLALRTRVAHLLAGGYRKQARRLNDQVRRQVWQRDNGLCVQCGKPGAEIDHINGDAPDLVNLQLLCIQCHHAKTAAQMVPADDDQTSRINELIATRVQPTIPALLCDDEERWPSEWSALKTARRRRLLDHPHTFG